MKKIIYLLLFAFILMVASCKQDKCNGVDCNTPFGTCKDGVCQCNSARVGEHCEIHTNGCDTIPCVANRGNCTAGTCNCLPHYLGDSCNLQEAPLHMYITGVTVNHFHPTSQSGITWDADMGGGNADIYPVIKRNGVVIFNGHRDYPTYCFAADANYDTQYNFNFHEDSIDITDPTNPDYRLELWDYDDTINDDLMESRLFLPYTGINGFPGSITVNDTTAYHDKFEFRVNISPYYKW